MKTYQITLTEDEDGTFTVNVPEINVHRQSPPIDMAAYLLSSAAEGMAEDTKENADKFAEDVYLTIVLSGFANQPEKEDKDEEN